MANRGIEKDTQGVSSAKTPRSGIPESISAIERHQRIERAAYGYSQNRVEGAGDSMSDWLQAEVEVDAELDAMEPSGSNPATAASATESIIDRGETRGNAHTDRIEPDQIAHWAEKLNVTKEELRVAVKDAGAEPAKVMEYLKSKKTR